MASIQILSGCREGQVLELRPKRQILGNSEKADVPIGDPWISRQHASIYEKDDRFWIEDLNSRNGTYVNCIRISKQVLSDEDLIFLGKTNLVFRAYNEDNLKYQTHSATRRALKFATDTSPLKSVQIPSIGDSRDEQPQPSRKRRKTTRTFKIEFPAESLRWQQQQDDDEVQTELDPSPVRPAETEALPALEKDVASRRTVRPTRRNQPPAEPEDFSPCAEAEGNGLFSALSSRTRAITRDNANLDDSFEDIFESSDEFDLEMSADSQEFATDGSQEAPAWDENAQTMLLDVVALSEAEAAEVLDNLEIDGGQQSDSRPVAEPVGQSLGRPTVVGSATQRMRTMEGELRSLREENARLRRDLHAATQQTERVAPVQQRETAKVLERLASLEAVLATREREIDTLTENLDVLTEKFIEKDDEIDRLQTALEEAEAQIAALSGRV